MLYVLAPDKWKPFQDSEARMLVASDIRKCVAFLGHGSISDPDFKGTGFILICRGYSWLVTARHVADDLGKDPFIYRLNSGEPREVDNATWVSHTDPNVDISIAALSVKGKSVGHLPEDAMLTEGQRPFYDVDLGNFAYVIGLFRVMPGNKRNFPVVHTGFIATLPEDELIPVRQPDGSIHKVKGYLVQTSSLDGLSGSPVFVRRTALLPPQDGIAPVAAGDTALLGVWVAAWNGPPDPTAKIPKGGLVPVGFGVVVPAERVVETVDEALKKFRKEIEKDTPAASTQSIKGVAVSSPASDENPTHLEDFKSLLTEAAKTQQQGD